MRTTTRLLYLIGFSFLTVDAAYLVWSLVAENFELIGLMTIGFSGLLCLLMAFYFGRVLTAGGPTLWAEDDPEAEVDDGDPEMGFYSPYSWWPVMLAGAICIALLGFAINAWIMFIAIPLLLITIVGWTYEYYRGYFAR